MQTFRWKNEKFVNFVALMRVFLYIGFLILLFCSLFTLYSH